MLEHSRLGERVFRGIPVSAGVCQANVLVLTQTQEPVLKRELQDHEIPREIERLEKALIQTRKQIVEVQHQVSAAMGGEEASIFEAHLLILEDQTLIEPVIRLIQDQRINVEQAFHQVAEEYFNTLSCIDDEYLRERAKDMRDVTSRVLNNLMGRSEPHDLRQLTEPCVLLSVDLSPSTTAQMDRKNVLGFATDTGSKTSHTAILARSLRIPAVVGLDDATGQLRTGQHVLLDGFNGLLILNPTDQTLFEYGQLVRKQMDWESKLGELHTKPAITLDGCEVSLSANIEQAADCKSVISNGAAGVGLFRTEYLFLGRDTTPSEEEQYQAYREVARNLAPHPVIIRTLDLGGDKFITNLHHPAEMNPSLGWRAIRFCLQEKELFRHQLRAILRASCEGNVKMMYPMISGLEELSQANALLEECKRELELEKVPFAANLEVGVMIEVPSAALIASFLAKKVAFFSIGTNDLIQYALAVDRMNDKIAHLYEPTHPAIIRLLKMIIDAAHQNGIWVGVCGEMAGDPNLVPLLLGLGADELSAAPPLIPQIKYLIRRLRLDEAKALAQEALECNNGATILEKTQALARRVAPGIFEH